MKEVDVAIVGGGVAGCAAALTLTRYTNLSVAVFERSSLERARPGEHVSDGALPLLQYLGVDVSALLRETVPGGIPLSAWGDAELRRGPASAGRTERAWFVDRARFDRMLADEARRRCALFSQRRSIRGAAFDGATGRWELLADGVRVCARALIDAGGIAAPVARALGGPFVTDDALYAVVGRVRGGDPSPRDLVLEASADGWWYAVPVPDDGLVVAFLTDLATMRRERCNRPAQWMRTLALTRHVAPLVAAREPSTLDTIFVPSRRLTAPAAFRWIAAGDAAMATDPLAAMGIGFALHSGASAARAIAAELSGDAEPARVYARRLIEAFDRYRITRRALYATVTRWSDRPFWIGRTGVTPVSHGATFDTSERRWEDGTACSSAASARS